MLRSVDGWESEQFAFGGAEASQNPHAPTAVAIDNGADGPTATIPDAHLLFTAQFSRAGADLVLNGEDGKAFVVRDYFASDEHARLLSPEGAALSPEVVAALAGPLAPGQFAQAGATPPAAQAVGRVVQADSDATIIRNGVAITVNSGDAILKGDVLQTVSGTLGVTFNDGSTLNLTANTRMIVNEFVYDPKGSANSQLLDLVQGSLTFISGEVAHNGDMRIGTPVATMGIRGTVGGVTTASDGTVNFYVSQSRTGAVILDSRGRIIANVVQDGPMIIVRPVGPLQVLAEEVQKSPAQLALELAALQQIVNIKAVGDAIMQQFLQPDPNANPNPNPQSTDKPHTQIQISIQPNQLPSIDFSGNGNNGTTPTDTATVTVTTITPDDDDSATDDEPIIIDIPLDLPPVNFGPLQEAINEDTVLVFSTGNDNAISVYDADTGVLTVTLTATHGVLTLSGVAGLSFSAGDGSGDATMTFSGTQATINAALDGMSFTPDAEYSGQASVKVATSDGATTSSETIDISVAPVDDAPTAPSFNETATAGVMTTANIVIILDISGSMNSEVSDGLSRLQLAKNALGNLLTTNAVDINQVMTVAFNSDVDLESGFLSWTDASSASDFINGLTTGGGTNYVAALNGVMNNWATGPSAADKTIVYFISDGQPSQALNETQETAWESFLSNKGVAVANAIGISTNVEDPDLAPIAWAPENDDLAPIVLVNATDLDATLQGTVADVHNIFTDGEVHASFGADGGHIHSVTVDGFTYTWDGNNTITKTGGEFSELLSGTSIEVTTTLGGAFKFAFGVGNGHAAGDWTYTPPEQLSQSTDEVFHYSLIDNDADISGADITVAVTANPAIAWTVPTDPANIAFDILNANDGFVEVAWGDQSATDGGTTFSHSYAQYFAGDLNISIDGNTLAEYHVVSMPALGNGTNGYVAGTAGNDILIGTTEASENTFQGNAGDDVMFATDSIDTFLFALNFGNDLVVDYTAGADILEFDDTIFVDVAAVLAAAANSGSDVVITYDGSNAVTLNNVTKAMLESHSSDIHIV